MVTTYKLFFARCMNNDNAGFTAGKNYCIVSDTYMDHVLNDNDKFEPIPSTGFEVLGSVRYNSTCSGMHDPMFKSGIKRAKLAFCDAMLVYYS